MTWRTSLLVWGAGMVLAGSGCDGKDVAEPFDPRGEDGSLTVEWTIGGTAADLARCEAAGISAVELTLYAADDAEFEDGVVLARAPCTHGRYDDETAILAAGRYRVSIDGVDEHGDVLDYHRPDGIVEVRRGEQAPVEPADFALLSALGIALQWGPTAGTCAEAGVDGYSYVLRDSLGEVFEEEIGVPCEERLVIEDLPADVYVAEVVGLDALGEPVVGATCPELAIAEGDHAEHACMVADAAADGGST